MSILVTIIIILGGIGSLRGVVIGAFVVQYVNQTLLPWLGEIFNDPINELGAALRRSDPKAVDFNLATYNYLIFGCPGGDDDQATEGLFPVEARKAEIHGDGMAADVTWRRRTSGRGRRLRGAAADGDGRDRREAAAEATDDARGDPMTATAGGPSCPRAESASSSAASSPSATSTSTSRAAGIVSLIGPNGAGKTTFFNMITGLYIPTAGSIEFDGNDITGSKPHEVVRAGIARTFQNIRLFGNMTAMTTCSSACTTASRAAGGTRSCRPASLLREEDRGARAGPGAARPGGSSPARTS